MLQCISVHRLRTENCFCNRRSPLRRQAGAGRCRAFQPKSDAEQIPDAGFAVTDSNGRFTLQPSAGKSRPAIEPGMYTLHLGWKNPQAVDDGEAVVTVKPTGKNHFIFHAAADDVT